MIVPRLALLIGALAAIWVVSGTALFHRLAVRQDARAAERADAVAAAVRAVQEAMVSEARLLARDPAVTEGVVRGDWATLARGASPRMVALTVERLADLLLILDASGAPLVQVPATPRLAGSGLAPPPAATSAVRVIGDTVYVLGLAPVRSRADLPVGVAVVGRRFDRIVPAVAGLIANSALVVVTGDHALATSRPDLPGDGWEAAVRRGRVAFDGQSWRVRLLEPAAGLVAVLPAGEEDAARRRLWFGLISSFALAVGAATVVAVFAVARAGSAVDRAGGVADAFAAIAGAADGRRDLADALGDALDVISVLAGLPGGVVLRLDETGRTLTPVACRGGAGVAAVDRTWSLDEAGPGDAIRSGRLTLTAVGSPERPVVAVPIPGPERAWGVIALAAVSRRAPTAAQARLLDALARQVGFAVGRAALAGEAQVQSRRLEGLARLTQTLTATLSLDEVLQRVVAAAAELFDSNVSRLWLLEDDGEHLVLRASSGVRSGAGLRRLKIGEGLSGIMAATRMPMSIGDVMADPRTRNIEWMRAEGTTSMAGVPLIIGSRLVGALWVGSRQQHVYAEAELRLLQSLGDHAAVAIQNARLFAEEQARRESLAALLEINKRIGATEAIDQLLTSIAEEAARLIGADNAAFRVVDGDEAVLAAVVGKAREAQLSPRLKIGESFSGRVIAESRTIMGMVDEVPAVIEAHRGMDERFGYLAYLGVPLRLGDRTLGVLSMRSQRPFTDRDREVAEAFAGQAAIALDHARLYAEASRHARRMAALADVERLLSETLDPEVVARRITDSVCSLLAARASALYRLEPETGRLHRITAPAPGSDFYFAPVLEAGTGLGGLAVRERTTAVTADSVADPRLTFSPDVRQQLEKSAHRAFLAVPLVIQDRVLGSLTIGDVTGRVFTPDDVRLARLFADQAALALDNARLHEETDRRRREAEELIRLARTLTESLDVATVGERMVETVRSLFGSASELWSVLRLVEPDGSLRAVAYRGGWHGVGPNGTWPPGAGLTGRIVAEQRPIAVADVLADPEITLPNEIREALVASGYRARVGVPLWAKGEVIGALLLGDRLGRIFTPAEITLLQAFADQAALALENARLHEETEQRRREAEVVAQIAGTITASLDLDTVLQRVVEGAREVCRSDTARIALREPGADRFRFRYTEGLLFESWTDVVIEPGRGIGGHALVTGGPVRTARYLDDPRISKDYAELAAAERQQAMMVVPIRIGDRVEGLLYVDNRTRRAFTDGEETSLVRLADHAAIAIRNAGLYQEAREYADRLRVLDEVNRLVSSSLDIDEVLRNSAAALARLFDTPYASIWELDEARGVLRRAMLHGDPDLHSALPAELALGQGGVGWSVVHREPIFWTDVEQDPRAVPNPTLLARGVRYLTTFPIALGDRVVGAFAVYRSAPGSVTEESLAIARSLAAQAAVAIDHARVYGEAQARLRETETLLEVSRTLASTADLDATLRQFLRQIATALGADSTALWMLDESGEWMTPLTGYHIPRELVDAGVPVRLSIRRHPFYAEAARTGRSVATSDAMSDPRLPSEVLTAIRHRSQLFAPIVAKDRMIGGLFAVWWEEAREVSPRDRALIEAVASQAGVAIENARLFQENRRRVEELSVLHRLSRAVTGQLERHVLLEAVRAELPRVIDADTLSVLLLDAGAGELEVALRASGGVVDQGEPRRYPIATGLLGAALEGGRPLRTDDYAAECGRRGVEPPATPEPPCWLATPMGAGDDVLGLLTVSRSGPPFTEADERLLANIADLAALALRSARLYEERTRAYGELAAAQDQLVRTEKLRALGEMASGVAHDFNNLLAAILGRSQLLLKQIDDPRLRQWLEVIERSAIDGAQTVRRLQEFARVRRDAPRVAVDLNDVVRGALDITQSRWRDESFRSGVAIDVHTRLRPVPPVAGDPAELREAMTNLILNAIDAMPAGGTLTFSTGHVELGVEVTVSDTGVGIPAAVREKIFDPFFTTKGPQGTGLGLAMTYGILSRHGARITVESEEGRGTTFRLLFPPAVATGAADEAAAPAAAATGLRCLVVDDEEAVGTVIGDVLETAGHQVVVMKDGAAAIERFRTQPFDVVFTDLAMPGISGWQVAKAVKSEAPHVPVFIVTGFGVELTHAEREAYGVEGIFAKPVKIEDLLAAAARVSRGRRVTNGPEGH